MNWQEVSNKLVNKITIGLDINTIDSKQRKVIEIPKYTEIINFQNEDLFYRVKIGENSFIKISLKMLIEVYSYSYNKNRRIYEAYVFQHLYPKQAKNKGCYVHSIGQLFVKAGIAKELGKSKYEIF